MCYKRLIAVLLVVVCMSYVGHAEESKVVKVPLTLYDRITIMNIVPRAGNYLEAIIISELRNKVEPTQAELEKYGEYLEKLSQGLANEKDKGHNYKVKIMFTTLEIETMNKAMDKMDKEKKVLAADEFIKLYKIIRDLGGK